LEQTAAEPAAGSLLRCANCGAEFLSPANPATAALVELEPVAPPVAAKSAKAGAAAASAQAPARKPVVFKKDRKNLEAEMDMTPMVDVTFQLLIFFMLTASFTMQKSLNVPKPETNQPSTQAKSVQDFEENPDYVVVRVDAGNTFHVSGAAWEDEIEAPSEQELLVKLRQAREGDGQNIPTKLLVVANGDAEHQYVVMAIDAGNDVGMDEVQLITVEDDSAF
jgi:biopolymer transport protein ExbD